MTFATIARFLLAAGLMLAGASAWSEPDAQPAASPEVVAEFPSGAPADKGAALPPDGTALRVAAAASATAAHHGPAPQGPMAEAGPEPPALLLVIAAVLVVVFVSTRRQNEDR